MTDEAKQQIIDFGVTFGSEHGQRVLKRLEQYCGYNSLCFDVETANAKRTAFNLGARSVYLFIKNILNMQKENENERQQTADSGN